MTSGVRKRPFRILADFPAVRDFLLRGYQRDWRGGVPAPFLEYALSADWADQTLAHRDALWEDGGVIVGFCFYESHLGEALFNLAPDDDRLADAMLDHAEAALRGEDGKVALRVSAGQNAIRRAAEARGYRVTGTRDDLLFDLKKPLERALPAGYRFVPPEDIDTGRVLLCCWKGFDHEREGAWDGRIDPGLRVSLAPNATPEYAVVAEHEPTGEYACYAGMWWVPENKLAYMEPLCTVPEHRRRGLAAAALSEMARRVRPLGAEWMTGGSGAFYARVGYEPAIRWLTYER